MNHAADLAFVAAEVAYRFETGRVGARPERTAHRHVSWARWVHPFGGRRSPEGRPSHRHARAQRA